MKKEEYTRRSLSGDPLILVEYRSTEIDEIRRKVVKAGESSVMPMIKHKVLVKNDSYEVAEFVNDGVDLKAYKAPFVMRDMVVFEIDGMEATKWGTRLKGSFHGKLE